MLIFGCGIGFTKSVVIDGRRNREKLQREAAGRPELAELMKHLSPSIWDLVAAGMIFLVGTVIIVASFF